ncbi:MAG: HD-GYP domain-containing protein, partial [Oceanidesulfovibrio sp.]
MTTSQQSTEYPIHVDQLCVGVYVRLDNSEAKVPLLWRKGFKIKSEKQIEKLKNIGLTEVVAVLDKSDRFPLPADPEPEPDPAPEPARKPKLKTPVSKELSSLKEETLRRNKERRERFKRCETQYETSVGRVAQLLRQLSGKSEEAAKEAAGVVGSMVDTFLTDRDVLVNLINTQPTEELRHYHALNVCVLSLMMGKELKLSEEHMHALGMGALMHDVGKGRMPVSELSRGRATAMKHAVERYYQQHPAMGAKIAQELPLFPPQGVPVILHHHEAMDGSGFPKGISGNKIAPLARIVSAVNIYDNLCNIGLQDGDVPLTPHEALKHIYNKRRNAIDGRMLSVFVRCIGVYPPGTVVQLSNGLVGMVVSINPLKSSRPAVMVYHADIPKKEALIVDLRVEEDLLIEKTVRPEELPREIFMYLSPSRKI